MSGNVAELCFSLWNPSDSSHSLRVIRGGDWFDGGFDYWPVAKRPGYQSADQTRNGTGFRVAFNAPGGTFTAAASGHTGSWTNGGSPAASAPASEAGVSSGLFNGSITGVELAVAEVSVNTSSASSLPALIRTDFADSQRVIITEARGTNAADRLVALFPPTTFLIGKTNVK
jgi:hypothetical protein